MADPDLEAVRAVVAEIPKGQLSERQMRIAAGLALIRDRGMPFRQAAAEVDIPVKTLWRHAQGLQDPMSDKGVTANETALVAASFDVAQMAAAKLTDRLLDEGHEWHNGDLVKLYSVATDKVALRLNWKGGKTPDSGDDGLTALAKLMKGHRLIAEPVRAGDDAIDVEAVSVRHVSGEGD